MQTPEKLTFATSTIADGNMSLRFGDEGEALENRQRFLHKHNIPWEKYIIMSCNHGDIIKSVDHHTPLNQDRSVEAEALVTQKANLALVLLTADCLPTVFYDPKNSVIALAHLNRKTIAHDLGQETVRFMEKNYSTTPSDLQVFIGPHIKKDSYRFSLPLETPPPAQLQRYCSEQDEYVYIDMAAAEISQLTAIGIKEENIQISPTDTFTSPEHFSHYESVRDHTKPHGRLATVAMLRSHT